MGFVLRVDVDKPYGRANVVEKIKSKLREDYWFPKMDSLGYLKCLEKFSTFCNSNNVRGMFYFRNCTIPNSKILKLFKEGNHVIGFHAENTKSFTTFSDELSSFRESLRGEYIDSFTKHGSGLLKPGKNHYPPFEPEKYHIWSKQVGTKFPFGNGICESPEDFFVTNNYYPKMFWIEREYRSEKLNSLNEITDIARKNIVPILIHPENFCGNEIVKKDFIHLMDLAKEASVDWVII